GARAGRRVRGWDPPSSSDRAAARGSRRWSAWWSSSRPLLAQRLETLDEFGATPVQPDPNGGQLRRHERGDLFAGQPLELVEDHHRPVIAAQTLERAVHGPRRVLA